MTPNVTYEIDLATIAAEMANGCRVYTRLCDRVVFSIRPDGSEVELHRPEGPTTLSFKAEVEVDGQWSTNALRFATEEEARAYGSDLFSRWTLTTGYRAAPSDDPVNYRFANGKLERLPEEAAK